MLTHSHSMDETSVCNLMVLGLFSFLVLLLLCLDNFFGPPPEGNLALLLILQSRVLEKPWTHLGDYSHMYNGLELGTTWCRFCKSV